MKKRNDNKRRKNLDLKELDAFASQAKGGGTNLESTQKITNRKENMERFTTAMRPEIKNAIQALAWYERVSQREIIEMAVEQVFPLKSDKVQEAIKNFNNK